MIVLDHVTKYDDTAAGRRYILDDVSFTFRRGRHYALLGRNGAGKSTLIRLLGGAEKPNEGDIYWDGSVSWPLGLVGGFQGSMTGVENIEFVCQVHGLDDHQTDAVIEFVAGFSELDSYLYMPVKTYSTGMGARLRFGLSLAFKFDYYLVDELTSVGDQGFRQKAEKQFDQLRDSATIIFASHSLSAVVKNCDHAVIVCDANLHFFEDVRDAIKTYKELYNLGGKKQAENRHLDLTQSQ